MGERFTETSPSTSKKDIGLRIINVFNIISGTTWIVAGIAYGEPILLAWGSVVTGVSTLSEKSLLMERRKAKKRQFDIPEQFRNKE